MPHWIKVALEILGAITLIIVLIAILVGVSLSRDYGNGGNPFE